MGLSVKVKRIINGFSLDAEWTIGNELAVLFGYSGAGKSLTIQMIAGLLSPDHGFIQLNERTYFAVPAYDDTSGSRVLFPHVFVSTCRKRQRVRSGFWVSFNP